ncbi:MAG: type III-A CRISPR-associated RAMP protein Csm3 [Candidatus Calescibacterium sp.]|nr:type III-A CRISPR-associated RAMP protein Csm3 [Candidatus Calescibacterium sp.]MDW8133154.1 type III-A CRISPR-associated RAMP protein Csm3 [Candidatus Calescibacterium sp.]
MCGKKECKVCGLFGNAPSKQESVAGHEVNIDYKVPTRIIVRDAYLIDESITDEMRQNMDFEYTEIKFENNLDRILSTANPRQTERVPAGAKFNMEIVVNRFQVDNVDDSTNFLEETLIAMKLLEDDYLGGQGTRGYGRVKFIDLFIQYRDINYYSNKSTNIKEMRFNSLSDIFDGKTLIKTRISDLS